MRLLWEKREAVLTATGAGAAPRDAARLCASHRCQTQRDRLRARCRSLAMRHLEPARPVGRAWAHGALWAVPAHTVPTTRPAHWGARCLEVGGGEGIARVS